MRLSDILRDKTERFVSLPASATALEAAALMKDEMTGAILVRDYRDRPLGLISERDLAVAIATRGAALFRSRLFDLMAASGPTASLGDSVHDVTRLMIERGANHVPVLDGETVVGVVSIGDLLQARLVEKSRENAVLRDLARTRMSG